MEPYKYSDHWIKELEAEGHWRLYWHQQKLMEGQISREEKIAEIGVGTGFTTNYLRSKGFRVQTIDIDPGKKPDIVANIVTCEEDVLKFDAVLAFNILEHIPYDDMLKVVTKFQAAEVNKLFICLPVNRKIVFELRLRLGRFLDIEKKVLLAKKRITARYHHWELDYGPYSGDRLLADLEQRGYACVINRRVNTQNYFYFRKK